MAVTDLDRVFVTGHPSAPSTAPLQPVAGMSAHRLDRDEEAGLVRFGRVDGIVVPVETPDGLALRLTVSLETGSRLTVIRDETLRPVRPLDDVAALSWHADQWTQETIGVEMALEGWEAVSGGEVPDPEPGSFARSASYVVRRASAG